MTVLLVAGWAASLVFAAGITVQIRRFTNVDLLPAPPAKPSAGFSDAHRAGWAGVTVAALAAAALAPSEALRANAGQLFLLASTIGGFLAGSAAPAGFQRIVHPLIACAAAANAGAAVLGAVNGTGWEAVLQTYLTKGKYGAPWGAGDLLMAFLHSVILSFGFRVFAQRALVKRCAPPPAAGTGPGRRSAARIVRFAHALTRRVRAPGTLWRLRAAWSPPPPLGCCSPRPRAPPWACPRSWRWRWRRAASPSR